MYLCGPGPHLGEWGSVPGVVGGAERGTIFGVRGGLEPLWGLPILAPGLL